MKTIQEKAEKLAQFNNITLTKTQWETVLKGCGCPKSPHLWKALRENNLSKQGRMYTLVDMDIQSFNKIWEIYTSLNREYVKKSYNKSKAIARVKARAERLNTHGHTFYIIGGVATTELPERD